MNMCFDNAVCMPVCVYVVVCVAVCVYVCVHTWKQEHVTVMADSKLDL